MRQDIISDLDFKVAIPPDARSGTTVVKSAAIDTKDYDNVAFVIALGQASTSGAKFAVTVKDGDTATQGDHANVEDKWLIGTEADAQLTGADDNQARKIGYNGTKRYVSIEINPQSNSSTYDLGVLLVVRPRTRPAS